MYNETVTVIAEPVPTESLAGTHTVIDHKAIVQSGAEDTAELLRLIAVVHLSQSGTKGALSTVSIRGAKPNFTLVLVDGVPMNDIGDLLGGAFNFATVPVEDIERVDVFRGPLSSIYGSEAIGGVISITLRRPGDLPIFRGSSEGGNYGYAAVSSGVSGAWKRLDASADGSYARMGQQVLDDGFDLGTAAVQADVNIDASRHLENFVRWNRLSSMQFPVSSGGPEYAISRQVEVDQANQIAGATTFQQQVNPKWFYAADYDVFSRVALSNTPSIFDSVPPGPNFVPATYSDTRFLRQRAVTVQQFRAARWLALDGTAYFKNEDGTSVGSLAGVIPASYSLSRPTGFFSPNAIVTAGHATVTAGMGVEKSNTYHTVVSPRAGASYTLGDTRLHASWGQGFKLPSFYSLSSPLVGNPKLTPEFDTGYDAGVERHFRRLSSLVSLTVFDNEFKDLIDFSPSFFKLVNRDKAYARGAELEASAAVRSVRVGGSVAYDDAGLKETTERLRDVPRWKEDVYVSLPLFRAARLDLSTAWVGRRFDYQVPLPQYDTVPRYTITNLKLTYPLRDGVSGFVRVENLFNSKYQEFVGFPSPGAYASAGITFSGRSGNTPSRP